MDATNGANLGGVLWPTALTTQLNEKLAQSIKKEMTSYSFKTIAQTAQPWLIKVVLYKGYTNSKRVVLGAVIEPAICGV